MGEFRRRRNRCHRIHSRGRSDSVASAGRLMMDLIREVLDNQIVDRNQRRLGKIDGILVEFVNGKPPLLVAVETGWLTKARRLHPRLAHWLWLRGSRAFQIPWTKIRDIGTDVEFDIDASETPLLWTEKKLRRLLMRIPGS